MQPVPVLRAQGGGVAGHRQVRLAQGKDEVGDGHSAAQACGDLLAIKFASAVGFDQGAVGGWPV